MNKEKIILGLGNINRFVSYVCAFLLGFSAVRKCWKGVIIFFILGVATMLFSIWIIDMKGYKELIK